MAKVILTQDEISDFCNKLESHADDIKQPRTGDIAVIWSIGLQDREYPRIYVGFWLIGEPRYIMDRGDYLGCDYKSAINEIDFLLG